MAKRQRIADSDTEKTYFELQREAIISDIALSFEHILGNINKLNRSLEEVIKMGNDFSSVEALWSQFENVMAKDEGDEKIPEKQEEEVEHESNRVDASIQYAYALVQITTSLGLNNGVGGRPTYQRKTSFIVLNQLNVHPSEYKATRKWDASAYTHRDITKIESTEQMSNRLHA
ncbi:hypothetical protein E4U58_006898 [Claviceps cyperi]|nr:hypothetical protein E4U58_006898 [Claviceps cyperi]